MQLKAIDLESLAWYRCLMLQNVYVGLAWFLVDLTFFLEDVCWIIKCICKQKAGNVGKKTQKDSNIIL